MNKSSPLSTIDWEAIYNQPWHSQSPDSTDKGHADYWNGRAGSFAKKAHHPENRRLAKLLLDKFAWNSEESVLDVGAGPGSYTIPLSNLVKRVVALDISTEMLEKLRFQAEQENRNNIELLPNSWLSVEVDKITGFDTVICFNALGCAALHEDGSCHMGLAIERLAKAARRGMILVPMADLPADRPMRQALSLSDNFARRERIALLYHIMVKYGLMPDLEIIARPFFWAFESLSEGVEVIGNRIGVAGDPAKMQLLSAHLSERFERVGDTLILQYPVSQALFSWDRDKL